MEKGKPVAPAATVTSSPAAPVTKPETKSAEAPAAKTAEKKEGKRGRVSTAGDHPLQHVIENYTKDAGNTVYDQSKVKGFRSLKVDGHMYAAFNFNKKGVTLWVRGEAVKGIAIPEGIPVLTMNHMFDTRIRFVDSETNSANNSTNIALIHKLLDASVKFQVEKKANTKKVQAEKAREAKKAEKAKAEAAKAEEAAKKTAEAPAAK